MSCDVSCLLFYGVSRCVLVSCGVSLCLSEFIELSVLPCFVSINTIIYFLYHLVCSKWIAQIIQTFNSG